MSSYTYEITITLNSKSNRSLYTISSAPYANCPTGSGDLIKIDDSCIRIIANRTKKFEQEDILSNSSNSIYIQILKALLCYNSITKSPQKLLTLQIKRISYFSRKNSKVETIANITYSDKNQPIKILSLTAPIKKNVLNLLWSRTNEPEYLVPALSHWLSAMSSEDRYFTFERLWRSFERIVFYIGSKQGKITEKDCLCATRNFLVSNSSIFPKTMALASKITYNDFRALSWRKLILNNYGKPGTNNLYKGYRDYFVKLNSDTRILQMIEDTLTFREERLNNFGYYVDIQNYLARKNRSPQTKDEEIVAIICCKYAYFVRNKMFHGENRDVYFSLSTETSDDKSLDLVNDILRELVSEFIGVFDQI